MENQAFISDPAGLIMVFVAVPALIFWLEENTGIRKIFRFIPALAFLCILPSLMVTFNIIPEKIPFYKDMKLFIIPPTLVLLTMTVDLKGIIRLGPKTLIMFFSGTLGVFLGAPLSYLIFHDYLPPDAWRGMAALAGSWIGGLGNFVAVGNAVEASDTIMGMMIILDLVLPAIWLTCLFYFAGQYQAIDKKTGANNSMVEELKNKIITYQKETGKIPTTTDYAVVLAVAFFVGYVCLRVGKLMPTVGNVLTAGTWMVIGCTTIGLLLSMTPFRRLDGVGASRIGGLFIYIMIAVLGAGANFKAAGQYPFLLMLGAVWMLMHIICITVAMKLIKAPLFFAAVGSQANIGGTATAPIVASAFHPSLASVGVLMALCGTFTGTYIALLIGLILEWMSKVL